MEGLEMVLSMFVDKISSVLSGSVVKDIDISSSYIWSIQMEI
jgi:hypothetical protein